MADTFGERAATEEEIEDWIDLVKAGRRAMRRFKFDPRKEDEPLPRPDDE